MRRKFFCLAVSLASGIIFTYFFSAKASAALCPALYFVLIFFFQRIFQDQSLRRFLLILVSFFLAGSFLLSYAQYRADTGYLSSVTGEVTEITGKIIKIEQQEEGKSRIVLKTHGERLQINLYQKTFRFWELLGKTASFRIAVEKPETAKNPRTFNYQLYLKSKGIFYTASAYDIKVKTDVPKETFYKIEEEILKKREQMLDAVTVSEEVSGLLRGILFGDTGRLQENIDQEFRQNGTAHLLAVSGLHVGILFGVYKLVKKRRKSALLTASFILLLLIYATAAMWSPSVARAVFLILMMLTADRLDRRYDLLTGLSLAAVLAVIRNPFVIFGAGFQMSFLAVMSIAFLLRYMTMLAGEAFGILFAVQLGLIPYMMYIFNYISFTAFLCNNPLILLTSALVPAGIFSYIVFFFTGVLPPYAVEMLNGLGEMMIGLNHIFNADGILSFEITSPKFWVVVLMYFLLFFTSSEYFFVCVKRREWKKILAFFSAMILVTTMAFYADLTPFDKADLVFLDVGQGDCLHIKGKDGENYLIDGGGSDSYNVGEKILKPYFLKNGFSSVKLALATHQHKDHFLGLCQLSESFPVEEIKVSGRAGEHISLGKDMWIEILWPLTEKEGEITEDENLNSRVFMVHDGDLKVLVTGDITAEGEKMMMEQYRGTEVLSADVLKVAHHGSAYSTCDEFLHAVHPKLAVISVGRNNYGHPSEMIIEKLQKNGIMVIRTDKMGAVGLIREKGRTKVCTINR